MNALLSLKKGVAQGDYSHKDILSVLEGFHEDSPGNTFKEHLVESKDPLTGKNTMVDGFTLTQNMPLSTARMVASALKVSSDNFKFPVSIGFERKQDGTATMRFTTKGDFAPFLMDDPRNIAAINVQRMANYSIARSLVKSLAYANAYQFDPEMQYMPFPPDPDASPRGLQGHVAHHASSYMGTHKAVTKALDERFTVRDVLEIKAEFRSGLETIKGIQPEPSKHDRKRESVAPRPGMVPPRNEETRVRPGF